MLPYVDYAFRWHQHVTGTRPTMTSTYRTIAKQQELYNNRASNPYPVNRPGDSSHNFGLGFDSWVPEGQMPIWVYIRRAVGFQVPENDLIHAEVPNWRAIVAAAGLSTPRKG